MDIKRLNIGILHSQIGKNDGVSIVIDQTVQAMTQQMGISIGNIFYLSGISASRLQSFEHDIFWHRNDQNKFILDQFRSEPSEGLDEYILENALVAKEQISKFVDRNEIDLLIVHNSCHPSNFILSVGTHLYFDELRKNDIAIPKYLLWWHDSHFERERFQNPNPVVGKYLNMIPGPHVDGIVFINSQQAKMAYKYCEQNKNCNDLDSFFGKKTATIPNTCSIDWNWKYKHEAGMPLHKNLDAYNDTFFADIGLLGELEKKGQTLDDCSILLQHTRVVKRKKIEHAIDFAFLLAEKYKVEGNDKTIALIISGNSGDEHDKYKDFLRDYYASKRIAQPEFADRVVMLFAEQWVFHSREMLPDRKLYSFNEVPAVVARAGGMGTYFSEVEGYGNNLLEMLEGGLPVIINRYEIYDTDIKHLGFDLIETCDGEIFQEHIDKAYQLLNNSEEREKNVMHNLSTLENRLNHKVMGDILKKMIKDLLMYH